MLYFFWFFPESLFPDDITIKATIDRHQVPLNENAILTVTISGANVGMPELPDFKDIAVYPSGQSQNITIVNGQMETSATYTYVLQPRSVGTFTIPPVQVKQNDKIFQTEPIQIEVTKAVNVYTKGRDHKRQIQSDAENTMEDLVFGEARVDKKEIFFGEQITFTYKFYRKINLLDQPKYDAPKFASFWVEDLPPEKLYYENINGERYVVSEIKVALFPTTSGDLLIEPAKITCRIPISERRDPFSFFDEDPFRFFNSDPFQRFSGKEIVLKTKPIRIKVKELPFSNRPKGFTGTVGAYDINAEIDRNETEVHQAVTLTITLEGKGNIQALSEPNLYLGDSFKLYPSGHFNEINKKNNIVQGKKIFKKLLIPLKAGSLAIPSIKFSFFNPNTKTYQTVKTQSLAIQAYPEKKKDKAYDQTSLKEGEQIIRKDIHFIKTNFDSFKNYSALISPQALVLSLSAPFMIFMASVIITFRRRIIAKNTSSMVTKKAYQIASQHLKTLRRQMSRSEQKSFFNDIEKIVTDYLSKKVRFPTQGKPFNEIKNHLIKSGADDRLIQNLKDLLDQLHFARYALSQTEHSQKEAILETTCDVLKNLEKNL
jgi:hypothetical protein